MDTCDVESDVFDDEIAIGKYFETSDWLSVAILPTIYSQQQQKIEATNNGVMLKINGNAGKMKSLNKVISAKPISRHLIDLPHHKQRFTWDCGISCVLMVLPDNCREDFLSNFSAVCKEGGFGKSTWTIDLCYLLRRYDVKHKFYTTTLGVHPGYRENSFYDNILTQDEQRIMKRFARARSRGISITKKSLMSDYLFRSLSNGPVIVLTNSRLLTCDICKLNKVSSELRKCLPWPTPYQGHYIVLCGYDKLGGKVFYRNPSFSDRLCSMPIEIFDKARNSYGTDEDLIFVFSKNC